MDNRIRYHIGEGITRREGEYLLRERLAGTHEDLTGHLPWLSDAPQAQQLAILDMGYQLLERTAF